MQVDKLMTKTRNHDKLTQKVEPFNTALEAGGIFHKAIGPGGAGMLALKAIAILTPMLDKAWETVSRLEDRIKVLEDDKQALSESLQKMNRDRGFGLEGAEGGYVSASELLPDPPPRRQPYRPGQ